MSWSIWSWWCPGISLGRCFRHELARPGYNMSSSLAFHKRWWLERGRSWLPAAIWTLSRWRQKNKKQQFYLSYVMSVLCSHIFVFTALWKSAHWGRLHQLAVIWLTGKAVCSSGDTISHMFLTDPENKIFALCNTNLILDKQVLPQNLKLTTHFCLTGRTQQFYYKTAFSKHGCHLRGLKRHFPFPLESVCYPESLSKCWFSPEVCDRCGWCLCSRSPGLCPLWFSLTPGLA